MIDGSDLQLTETSMARARVQTLLTLKSAKLEAEDIYRYFTCLKMPYSVNLKLYVVIYATVFLLYSSRDINTKMSIIRYSAYILQVVAPLGRQ